jgi:WD40-like Beta Propeller Repeat
MRIGFLRAATMLWCASCTGDPPRSSPIVGAEAGSLDAGSLDAGSLDAGGAGLDAAKPDGAPNPGDAGLACDRTKDFGAPTVLVDLRTGISHTSLDRFGDQLVVTENYVDLASNPNLALSKRENPSSTWKKPVPIADAAGAQMLGFDPAFSADGLTLYFASKVTGAAQVYRTSRKTLVDPFSPDAAVKEGPVVNAPDMSTERPRFRSYPGGSEELCVARTSPGGSTRIACLTRKPGDKVWSASSTLEGATRTFDSCPVPSADGKTLYFCTSATNKDNQDIWMAHRASLDKPWSMPKRLEGVNEDGTIEQPVWISDDECTMYFTSTRMLSDGIVSGPYDIFVARRPAN